MNDGGTFTASGQAFGDHAGFGIALGDLDGDGDLDAFAADYFENRVWLNEKATLRVDSLTPTTTGLPRR